MNRKKLNKKRARRKNRARKKIGRGNSERPRLSVFRSNKHIYAQIINDEKGKTIASASSMDLKSDNASKTEQAEKVGKKIAKSAKEKKIQKVIFDKGRYNYHGRVKALAEGARDAGLNF